MPNENLTTQKIGLFAQTIQQEVYAADVSREIQR